MKVYDITVEFRRRVTPKEYEHAEAFGRLSAQAEDDTDIPAALDTLLETVKTAVLTHLGRSPGRDTQKATSNPPVPEDPPAPPQPDEDDDMIPAAPKDEGTPGKGKRGGPAPVHDNTPPDPDELMAEEAGPEVDDNTLMETAQRAVKKIGPNMVKQILTKFDCGKLSELSGEERKLFVAELEKALSGKQG